MAAIRHLEFSKFGILVTRPVLERDSALFYKISRNADETAFVTRKGQICFRVLSFGLANSPSIFQRHGVGRPTLGYMSRLH